MCDLCSAETENWSLIDTMCRTQYVALRSLLLPYFQLTYTCGSFRADTTGTAHLIVLGSAHDENRQCISSHLAWQGNGCNGLCISCGP